MESSSWEDEPAAGYGSTRQGRSAVAAGRYGRALAGQGVTTGQQGDGRQQDTRRWQDEAGCDGCLGTQGSATGRRVRAGRRVKVGQRDGAQQGSATGRSSRQQGSATGRSSRARAGRGEAEAAAGHRQR